MVYNSTDDFLNSSFYEKYKKKMKLVKAITSFGADDVGATQTRAKDIPGKRLRIIFRSSSYTDNNQYMLDPKDADEYLEVLSAAKDSHILLPVEFYAMFNLKRFAKDRQEQVSQNIETWHKGYAWGEYYGFGEGHEKGYKEGHEAGYQEGYKQKQSEESSSGWSDVLGTVASVGLKLLL
jgi:hypothetical protein